MPPIFCLTLVLFCGKVIKNWSNNAETYKRRAIMELFAIIGGIFCLIVGAVFSFGNSFVSKCIFVAILLQLFWFPLFFETRTETETRISNKHRGRVFEQPVKITKTRIYKPLSVFSDQTTYTVEFIK